MLITAHPFVALLALLLVAWILVLFRAALKIQNGDSTVWEREIRQLEKADRRFGTPRDVVVFAGSSSIRFWKTLQADMSPVPVTNRGFGGSQIHDVTFYADRAVLACKPKAIVFYAGENDMAGVLFTKKKTAQQVCTDFQQFCAKIRASNSDAPIYFISIKPPKRRIAYWPAMQIANNLVRDYCATDPRLHFIDVTAAMSDKQGNPRHDLFWWDGLHMNAKGYAVWTAMIKPLLAEALPRL